MAREPPTLMNIHGESSPPHWQCCENIFQVELELLVPSLRSSRNPILSTLISGNSQKPSRTKSGHLENVEIEVFHLMMINCTVRLIVNLQTLLLHWVIEVQ